MPGERFFLEQPPAQAGPGTRLVLSGDEAHHLRHVRRVRIGDTVVLFDGSGRDYVARVEAFGRSGAELDITEVLTPDTEPSVEVSLAAAVVKQQAMDQLVDSCTQLGMKRLIPMLTARSVVKPGAGRAERWRRIAIEACKQCGRSLVPEIEPACAFTAVLARTRDFEFAAIASPGAERPLVGAAPARCKSALILIGPEGGFTPDEEEAAARSGCVKVSLARSLLRTETAAAAALAQVVGA